MIQRLLAVLAGLAVLVLPASHGLAQGAPPEAPAAATAGPISLEAFAQIPFIEQADMSPGGKHLAGLFGIKGQQSIAIIDLFDKSATAVFLRVPESTQATWVRWVNDDHIIVGLQALLPIDFGERWVISRLIGVSRSTGKVTKLLWDQSGQDTADVLRVPSDGSAEILVAAQGSIYLGEEFWPAVYQVNVATGKKRLIDRGRTGVTDWRADAAGTVRAAIAYTDRTRTYRLLYRGEGSDGSFKTVDTADGRQRDSVVRPFLFLPGTDKALARHDNEQGRTAIYEVDLTTQKDIRQVFVAPGEAEVEGVELSADGQVLLGARLSDVQQTTHWFDPELAKLQADIDKAVGTRRARIISMSANRSQLLVLVDRADTPGGLYYYDVGDGTMRRIASINEALGAGALNPVRLVSYKARDGLKIEAVLTLPRGRPASQLPIVMMPHGGPWGQDTLQYDYWAQFIASRGYAVLQPNFRGSTGYGTAFLRAGEGQMGLAMQDDISDGLAWAAGQGIADPKRACIVGASYGGYAAMWGIAKDPELYRCAVSIAGVANLRREVNDFGGTLFGGAARDAWQRMTPDFAGVSPINAIARIKAPLLLIHGRKDITVDAVQSASMYARMRDAGKAVEYVPLAEADHHFTRQADRVVLLGAIEAFLAKHNPADPPAPTPAN